MSAQPAPPERELTARVVLGTSRVALKIPGSAALSLDEKELTGMFRLGLLLGRPSGNDTAPAGELRAKGNVKFLVGRFDIGLQAGLRAVRDGIEVALNSALRDLRHPKPASSPSAEDAPSQPTGPLPDPEESYGAAVGRKAAWPPDEFVEEPDFAADVDAWIDRADDGVKVVITRNGRPVAAMTSWERYRSGQERRARIEAAYWHAWTGGRFDPAWFVDLADEQIAPDGGLSTKPLPHDDGEDEGGGDAGTG